VPELARYAADPKTAPALIRALEPDPDLRNAVLAHLAGKGEIEAAMRLAESGAGSSDGGDAPQWQNVLLQNLVEKGEIGRADAELASQLLQLTPGRHVLSFTVSGSSPKGGGVVSWKLECARSKADIATIALNDLSYTPRRLNLRFDVPASCPAQWLKLTGTTADLPSAHNLTISDLQVRRAT
jgi:hypothetical protein